VVSPLSASSAVTTSFGDSAPLLQVGAPGNTRWRLRISGSRDEIAESGTALREQVEREVV
jgi:hypothetical protein